MPRGSSGAQAERAERDQAPQPPPGTEPAPHRPEHAPKLPASYSCGSLGLLGRPESGLAERVCEPAGIDMEPPVHRFAQLGGSRARREPDPLVGKVVLELGPDGSGDPPGIV